jgi:hypothetical protein
MLQLCERIKTTEDVMNKRNGWKANGLDSILVCFIIAFQKPFLNEDYRTNYFQKLVVERKSNSMASNSASSPNTVNTLEDEQNKSTSSLYPDLVQAANQRRKLIKVSLEISKSCS